MRSFILDTDFFSDCDDAVALRVLTRAVRDGRARLLGVAIDASVPSSVGSVVGFLSAEGLHGIPVGIDRTATGYEGEARCTYQTRLAKDFAPGVTNEDGEDAVTLYRRLLAEADERVEIIGIGFLGALADLLRSMPDETSEKNGVELVREKVEKIWLMGGKWDEDGGIEHNFALNEHTRTSAHSFFELCPVPVTLLGFEVGLGVITGGQLNKSDHLFRVMCDWGAEDGRHSWDPMLLELALTGDEEEAGYAVTRGRASVDPESGRNYFVKDAKGIHKTVRKLREDAYYAKKIDEIIR